MKNLYLLRHAQAGSALSVDDKDRPLSDHGIKQTGIIAPHLKEIDLCLCSSAKRTCMTLQGLEENGVQIKRVEYLDSLYNAPMGDILSELQKCTENNILIIAHNPGIHQLAGNLADTGDKMQLEKVKLFYQPATLSIFECEIDQWNHIHLQANKLTDLVIPD